MAGNEKLTYIEVIEEIRKLLVSNKFEQIPNLSSTMAFDLGAHLKVERHSSSLFIVCEFDADKRGGYFTHENPVFARMLSDACVCAFSSAPVVFFYILLDFNNSSDSNLAYMIYTLNRGYQKRFAANRNSDDSRRYSNAM
eukprot:GHVU01118925.1.p1 GENE.GHVU01118925.1~~GHVU01118925.1.p1  ORF type:complete len:140 (+),score=12.75 GHVU01118925.1:1300-1719(+)